MKNYTIKELLFEMGISKKYKRYDKRNNEINLEKLTQYDFFQKLFSLKYLELFSIYYNNEQPLKDLSLFDKKIIFSKDTKPFYHLLQKNKELREHIIYFTKVFYLSEENTIESDWKDYFSFKDNEEVAFIKKKIFG